MEFDLKKSISILERTPLVLEALLDRLDNQWIENNEGGNSWSPFDVLGHLIHGEKTDWIQRMQIILSDDLNKTFDPFDMIAHFEESKNKTLKDLLNEFKILRKSNIQILVNTKITSADLLKEGIHPALGRVNLQQLIATWTIHDLGHIAQISRVMAKQYTDEVGAWKEYSPVLHR